MASNKPGIPRGTRDFDPETTGKREHIFNTIKQQFRRYGFMPLETPAMERLDVLTGKYGEEGDQLIFKVLNSGDYLNKVPADLKQQLATEANTAPLSNQLTSHISEKALRYDLTVPFARYVVMNRHNITFPFRRYQMQPVWRADRPQKGRYREFYQCDADVIGTDSLIPEAELLLLARETLDALGLKEYAISINNRKVLSGLTQWLGKEGYETELCTAIDKLDKIGWDGVEKELQERGFSGEETGRLRPFMEMQGSNRDKIQSLKENLADNALAMEGLEEVEKVLNYFTRLNQGKDPLEFELTLARGLAYYTGTIFEIRAEQSGIGSIGGGGRYDNLTGVFGLDGISGVGISFGVDRIYDVLNDQDLFPEQTRTTVDVLVTNFGEETEAYALECLNSLRASSISSEIFPEHAKLKKQMNYANKKNIPYVLLIGDNEVQNGTVTLKTMETGEQHNDTMDNIKASLSSPDKVTF